MLEPQKMMPVQQSYSTNKTGAHVQQKMTQKSGIIQHSKPWQSSNKNKQFMTAAPLQLSKKIGNNNNNVNVINTAASLKITKRSKSCDDFEDPADNPKR